LDIFASLFIPKGRNPKKITYIAQKNMPGTIEYASEAPARIDGASTYARLPKHMLLPNQRPDYLRLILTARVYDIVKETPLVRAAGLSARLGNEIYLKREDLHDVFSFKIRGAYNFMASLPEDERWKGVITCSAGKCH
jgi:threonine dehydratase